MLDSRDVETSPDEIKPSQHCEIRVLIVHDKPLISAGLAATLSNSRDFVVTVDCPGSCGSDAHPSGLLAPDVVVADLESGLRLIAANHAWKKRLVILTHSDGEAQICDALERGARGYLLIGISTHSLTESLRLVHAGGIALDPVVARRVSDRMTSEALTRREKEILAQLMLGLSNKQIALNLVLSEGTVKTHVKSILNKLEAVSRTQAVIIAQRRGILGLAHEPLSVARHHCRRAA
jgi:DNA-binding NarL/FixJ family response regulator